MYSKVFAAAVFLLAVAYCQEHSHSYSLSSIKHEEPRQTYHSIPAQTYQIHAAPIQQISGHGQSHGQAVSSQSIIRHESGHQQQQSYGQAQQYHSIPAQTYQIHAAPIQQISGHGQSHGQAVSSQSIIRHESGHQQQQSYGQAQQYVAPIHHAPAPVHEIIQAAPIHQIQSSGHGQAVSSQSIVRHDSHGQQQSQDGHYVSAPIQTINVHSAPIQQVNSHSHGHAVSSQSIIRHDNHQSQSNQGSLGHYSQSNQGSGLGHYSQSNQGSGYYSQSNQGSGNGNYGQSNQGSQGHYIIPVQHHAVPIQHTVSLHSAPIQHHYVQSGHQQESHHEDYHAHPKYEFEYKIEDPHTGDSKFQHEVRDGDKVEGVYGLHEADGSIRTVKYSADDHTGFNAEVSNSGVSQHTEAQAYHH